MKKSAIYIVVLVAIFSTTWSMIINNNINSINEEIDQVVQKQIDLDIQIRLKEAELAFITNPKNLKNLNTNFLNLVSRPLTDIRSLNNIYKNSIKITKAQTLVNKETN